MEGDTQDPAGLHLTWDPLDHSRATRSQLGHLALPQPTEFTEGYDIGVAIDYNAIIIQTKADTIRQWESPRIDPRPYDFGAAADYNSDLMHGTTNGGQGLEPSRSSIIPIWSLDNPPTLKTQTEAQSFYGMSNPGLDHVLVSDQRLSHKSNLTTGLQPTEENLHFFSSKSSANYHPDNHAVCGPMASTTVGPRNDYDPSYMKLKVNSALGTTESQESSSNDTLQRHLENVHTRNFAVCCPVYGCDRTNKPIHRKDKFLEHLRKHDRALQYRCLVEDCSMGPFTLSALNEHLGLQHSRTEEGGLEWLRKLLGIDSDIVPLWFLRIKVKGDGSCPVNAPLGSECSYRIRLTEDIDTQAVEARRLRAHVHLRHFENVDYYDRLWQWPGRWSFRLAKDVICPVCEEFFCQGIDNWFIHARQTHTKEQYFPHLVEIYRILQRIRDVYPQAWAYLFNVS
ncbi:hypothetical protein NHQ30_004446 [Ciborinia camelliae]|nr:hypothetical protein NHQ30_004446 [Ciborinia camelliae]